MSDPKLEKNIDLFAITESPHLLESDCTSRLSISSSRRRYIISCTKRSTLYSPTSQIARDRHLRIISRVCLHNLGSFPAVRRQPWIEGSSFSAYRLSPLPPQSQAIVGKTPSSKHLSSSLSCSFCACNKGFIFLSILICILVREVQIELPKFLPDSRLPV